MCVAAVVAAGRWSAPARFARRRRCAPRRPGSGRARTAPPHLRPRQVVRAAHRRPDAAAHRRVEHQPVGGVEPAARHALRRRAVPTGAAVVAGEQPDVGVVDEHVPGVEGIEVHAVIGGHVQPGRSPAAAGHAARVGRGPGRPAVERAQRASRIGFVADLRLLGRDAQVERILAPIRAETLAEPAVVDGRRFLARLAPDVAPGGAEVFGFGDAERLRAAVAFPVEAHVGHVRGGTTKSPRPVVGRQAPGVPTSRRRPARRTPRRAPLRKSPPSRPCRGSPPRSPRNGSGAAAPWRTAPPSITATRLRPTTYTVRWAGGESGSM